jgi:hypothetical protein
MYKIDRSGEYPKIVATELIKKHREIGVWCIKYHIELARKINDEWYEQYPLGRWCGHTLTPNTYPNREGEVIKLYANSDIQVGETILVDFNWAVTMMGYRNENKLGTEPN